MDLNEELEKYNASGFNAINEEIQQKIKESEDKSYILCVVDRITKLEEKINSGFFPQNSFIALVSSHDYDIGNVVEMRVSDNVVKYTSNGFYSEEKIKNILLTPDMKSSLLNTQLQSELFEKRTLKMKKL